MPKEDGHLSPEWAQEAAYHHVISQGIVSLLVEAQPSQSLRRGQRAMSLSSVRGASNSWLLFYSRVTLQTVCTQESLSQMGVHTYPHTGNQTQAQTPTPAHTHQHSLTGHIYARTRHCNAHWEQEIYVCINLYMFYREGSLCGSSCLPAYLPIYHPSVYLPIYLSSISRLSG